MSELNSYPWFKFSPELWENGDINFMSMEHQGVFLQLCILYWKRTGSVRLDNAKRLFDSRGWGACFIDLYNDKLFTCEGGNIRISFLDEQLKHKLAVSEQNRKNGSKGGKISKPKVNSKRPITDGEANASQDNKSKRVKDNKIIDKKNTEPIKHMPPQSAGSGVVLPWSDKLFVDAWAQWLDYKKTQHRFSYKNPKTEQAAVKYLNQLANGQMDRAIEIINYSIAQAYKGFYEPNYLKNGTAKKDWRDNDKNIGDRQQQFIRDQAAEVLHELAQGDNP